MGSQRKCNRQRINADSSKIDWSSWKEKRQEAEQKALQIKQHEKWETYLSNSEETTYHIRKKTFQHLSLTKESMLW